MKEPGALFSFIGFMIVIFIILLYRNYNRNNNTCKCKLKKEEIDKNRAEIGEYYFDDSFKGCQDVSISNSYGLLADAIIVCAATKELPATPIFYFESTPEKFCKNGWFFVNLDTTDFQNFEEKSPQNIICKTRQAYSILKNKYPSKNVLYTGFSSLDKYVPSIQKNYRKYLHLAGKSPFKGTNNVINVWKNHPEWPELIFICRNGIAEIDKLINIKNLKVIDKYLSEEELTVIMNECGIHICPSEHEGFGHYINEAKGVQSVVLFSDAPSMNEFFLEEEEGKNKGIGIPIKTYQHGLYENICPQYQTTETDLEKAVEQTLFMAENELEKMGQKARLDFLDNDAKFKAKMTSLIKGTRKIPHIIHFIWISKDDHYIDNDIPAKYNKYIKTWQDNNPEFQFMFWSGKKIFDLIHNFLPEFLSFYTSLSETIKKCDFARFCVVYLMGGVYSDLDFFCRKNIAPLLECESFGIFEPDEHLRDVKGNLLCNGFFAGCPFNEFFYGWLNEMSQNSNYLVLLSTGPIGFFNFFQKSDLSFMIGNTCFVMPVIDTGETSKQCSNTFNNFTASIWKDGSGWGSGYGNEDNFKDNKSFFINTLNPIDNIPIIWQSDEMKSLQISDENIFRRLLSVPKHTEIQVEGKESILFAHALKNIYRNDLKIIAYGKNLEERQFIDKLAILNGLNNLVVNSKVSIKK